MFVKLGCIQFFSLNESLEKAGTPYLDTRHRACNLCMNCTQICPTEALSPIEKELENNKRRGENGGSYCN